MAASAPREIVIRYRPHLHQRAMHEAVRFHRYDARPAARRFAFWVCHRRYGKTVAIVNHLIRAALTFPRADGRFAYIGPLLKQAKINVWDYFKAYASPIPGVEFNNSELRIDFPNKAKLWLFGADNPDALRGGYLDLAALDEFGQMYRRMWGEIIRPMLADREGCAIVSGTPKGKNAFYDLYEQVREDAQWDVRLLPISRTLGTPGLPISADELELIRAEVRSGITTQAEYDQEYECSWAAAMRGAYFAEALALARAQGRIGRVPYDPAMRVHAGWDLGWADQTVVWAAQSLMSEARIISCHAWQGRSLPEIVRDLKALPYVWGEDLLPHDAEAHELGSGKTRTEILASLGRTTRILPRMSARLEQEEDERISAIRTFLPRCVFDEKACEEGLEGLAAYRRAENARGELTARPVHDWASNYADAFGQLAQGLYAAPKVQRTYRLDLRGAAPT